MKQIAKIHSDFPEKFGIPRQSNLATDLTATIIFEPEYRNPDAFTGLEGFDYIWLLWQFSTNTRDGWSATVRPPRLGGNAHRGVFATRSPFRPNPIGLSSVKLDRIQLHTTLGPILHVSGADLMDGTPIYDIKPYLPYTDSHPEARGGFTEHTLSHILSVEIADSLLAKIPPAKQQGLLQILAQDPRPSYQSKDPERIYGMQFDGFEIKFMVTDHVLQVITIQ